MTSPWQQPAPSSQESSDDVVDLTELASDLLATARAADDGKAAMKVLGDATQRVMLIALTTEGKLPEHASPPAATLHTLTGRMRLHCQDPQAGNDEWIVGPGHIVPIPPHRHAVDCLEDGVFVLTVSLVRPEDAQITGSA